MWTLLGWHGGLIGGCDTAAAEREGVRMTGRGRPSLLMGRLSGEFFCALTRGTGAGGMRGEYGDGWGLTLRLWCIIALSVLLAGLVRVRRCASRRIPVCAMSWRLARSTVSLCLHWLCHRALQQILIVSSRFDKLLVELREVVLPLGVFADQLDQLRSNGHRGLI